MKYLVALKCINNCYGCNCHISHEEYYDGLIQKSMDEVELEWKENWNMDRYDICNFIIVESESELYITLDTVLMQQGFTEYESALEIWNDFVILEEFNI